MSTTDPSPPTEVDDWEAVQDAPEFRELRHRLRSFVFPVTGLFLAWYLLYVLLASYAAGFMSIKLFGNVNVALVFGLLQILSTFAITAWYLRFADRRFDPLSEKLRRDIEHGEIEHGELEHREIGDRQIEDRDVRGNATEEKRP